MADNSYIFLSEMQALQDNRYFTVRKKIWNLKSDIQSTLHWHDYYEIEIILGGAGTHILSGENYPLHRGCAYLLSPKDFHTVTESPDDLLQLYNINFSEQYLPPQLAQALNNVKGPFRITFDEAQTCRVEKLMEELLAEYEDQNPNRNEMMQAMFVELLILMLRQKRAEADSLPDNPKKLILPVNQVINHLKLHFRESVSLSACARTVYLTPNYLGELFHRYTGMSFNEYILHLRLDYAVNLLNLSPMSVEEISKLSGFHSASYFIAQFRKQFGITPSQYRKLDEPKRNALMREKLKKPQPE